VLDAIDVLDPSLSINKIANVSSVDGAGDLINYTITVANAGNVTLTGVVLTDEFANATLLAISDTDSDGELDVGESWIYNASHTVTQAEMDAGDDITNLATVDTDQTELAQSAAVTEADINAARVSSTPYTINNTAYADSNQTDQEQASETVEVQINFEGLSHGYWKTHPSDWDGVGTKASFENFFFGSQQSSLNWLISTGAKPNKLGTVSDITFEQALALKGGGAAALAREAVASILNIRDEDVTYRFTESQVKEWVSEALSNQAVDINNDGINEFAAGSAAIIGVKNLLEANNTLELA
jgi:uncharacterized repeat protein (TIGR01451 family)